MSVRASRESGAASTNIRNVSMLLRAYASSSSSAGVNVTLRTLREAMSATGSRTAARREARRWQSTRSAQTRLRGRSARGWQRGGASCRTGRAWATRTGRRQRRSCPAWELWSSRPCPEQEGARLAVCAANGGGGRICVQAARTESVVGGVEPPPTSSSPFVPSRAPNRFLPPTRETFSTRPTRADEPLRAFLRRSFDGLVQPEMPCARASGGCVNS